MQEQYTVSLFFDKNETELVYVHSPTYFITNLDANKPTFIYAYVMKYSIKSRCVNSLLVGSRSGNCIILNMGFAYDNFTVFSCKQNAK